MIKILNNWGYYIGDREGKTNRKANIVDFFLFTIYFVLSLVNSFSANSSNVIFVLNTISIGRFVLKNYMEQCKIVSTFPVSEGFIPANITKVHIVRIVSEATALILVLVFVFWDRLSHDMSDAVALMVVIVIFMTWIENAWCMVERLYDAKPLPLIMNN